MTNLLDRFNIKPNSIKIRGNVRIIDDGTRKYILKKSINNDFDIYNYLNNRNFSNYPKIINNFNDEYTIFEYIDDNNIESEQRISDMIYLLTMLHNKTTFYKEFDLDYIKEIYEKYMDKFNYLNYYYNDLQDIIEEEIYMSPSNYLLIRNITNIYSILNYGKDCLNKWFNIVKEKKTLRYVLNHNNLSLDHFIENSEGYFISWDKSDFGFNVNDLYSLYINNLTYLDLKTILELYENRYKLYDYEFFYLVVMICDIDKIDMTLDEESKIYSIYKLINYVNNALVFLLENYSNKTN